MLKAIDSLTSSPWSFIVMAYGGYHLLEISTRKTIKMLVELLKGNRKVDLVALKQDWASDYWNTVIFFPDYDWINTSDSPLFQLIDRLQTARISICVCMFLMENEALMKVLKSRFDEGRIIVRIIVNNPEINTRIRTTRIYPPLNAGIDRQRHLMHHKFVVIDGMAVITGSLNWTDTGIYGNQENLLISSDPRHVRHYVREFNLLWKKSQLL